MCASRNAAAAAALALLALAGCAAGAAGRTGNSRGRTDSGSLRVTRGPFKETLAVSGKLVASEAERLSVPLLSNWRTTAKWLIEEGKEVRAGDVVARLDPAAQSVDLVELKNNLANKRQERALKLADADRERLELQVALEEARLESDSSAIDAAIPADVIGARKSEEQKLTAKRASAKAEQAKLAMDTQKAKLAADVRSLDFQIATLEEQQARTQREMDALEIHAGRAGIVVYEVNPWNGRKVSIGDTLQSTMPLIQISDVSGLAVEGYVPESEAGRLHAGQRVTMRLDAFPTRTFSGAVRSVALNAEPRPAWGTAYYFITTIAIDKADESIMKPGMSVLAEVTIHESDDALLVPLRAVRYENGGFTVRPRGAKEITLAPLGVDDFSVAVAPGKDLADGAQLEEADVRRH